jgi:hypothetical protein
MTHVHSLQLSVGAFLLVELAAAAALALWTAVRFPRLGPTSLRTAIGLAAIATGLVDALPYAVRLVAPLPEGAYASLFGCVLPVVFASFLVAAWLFRILAGNLPGSRAY